MKKKPSNWDKDIKECMHTVSYYISDHSHQVSSSSNVGMFRGRSISSINSFRQRALVIWKEQTKTHQYTQQNNVDIL